MSSLPEQRSGEQALAAIPDFTGARITSRLSDGPANASFLVEQGGAQFVLRLDKPGARELGLDRSQEMQINTAVAAAGLSPEPLFFDPASGVYLRRYASGRSWTVSDLVKPSNQARLAGLLRILHGMQPIGAAFDPLAAVSRYSARLDSEQARSALRECETLMTQISARPERTALCHNDLVCQNILEGPELMLIDWEYAGIGDPYFDLAVVVRHHGLDEQSAQGFLDSYLERTASTQELMRLDLQCQFYGYLLNLWNQLHL